MPSSGRSLGLHVASPRSRAGRIAKCINARVVTPSFSCPPRLLRWQSGHKEHAQRCGGMELQPRHQVGDRATAPAPGGGRSYSPGTRWGTELQPQHQVGDRATAPAPGGGRSYSPGTRWGTELQPQHEVGEMELQPQHEVGEMELQPQHQVGDRATAPAPGGGWSYIPGASRPRPTRPCPGAAHLSSPPHLPRLLTFAQKRTNVSGPACP